MLSKVISGCQTGADQAGLAAAYYCGLATGGYIPKGHKTLDGPRPDLTRKYKLTEHSSTSYKERTWDNVQSSDATIRFATNFNSPGEKCTYNAIKNFNKLYLDILLPTGLPLIGQKFGILHEGKCIGSLTCESDVGLFIRDWLEANGIAKLNVAGNSEATAPGIYDIVYKILCATFLFNNIKYEFPTDNNITESIYLEDTGKKWINTNKEN